jgi:hypothetical protein
VRWTFAVEPSASLAAGFGAAKTAIGDMFDQAMANLGKHLAGARS